MTDPTESFNCQHCNAPLNLNVALAEWQEVGIGEWIDSYFHFGPGTITIQQTTAQCPSCSFKFPRKRALFVPDEKKD